MDFFFLLSYQKNSEVVPEYDKIMKDLFLLIVGSRVPSNNMVQNLMRDD